MTRRSLLLCAITVIALALVGAAPLAATDRDPLASVVEMEAPQLTTEPEDLFTEDQRGAITAVVNEARLFGVPIVVRAITVPTMMDLLDDQTGSDDATPDRQEIVQRMAEERLADETVETSPGAEDGILLLVVVPEDDHRQSLAAFATGTNALPLNGLTHQRLDEALEEVIYPFFAADTISPGIQSGIAYLSYDNLFAVPARLERSPQQDRLQTVTNGIAAVTVLGAAGLVLLVAWITRRSPDGGTNDATLTPLAAAALAHGRVDDQILTGAILRLVDIGVLEPRPDGDFRIDRGAALADPFLTGVQDVFVAEADDDGLLPSVAIRRSREIMTPAKATLEDDLAARGLFDASARVEQTWIRFGVAALAALVLFTVVPSLAAMSRLGIAAIGIGSVVAIATWLWMSRRSWTTPAGTAALAQWIGMPPSAEDARTYDLTVRQDDLLAGAGGPTVPPQVRLVREIRALGAG